MQFAVFTVGLPDYTPEQAITILHEVGYDGIEWRVTDQEASRDGTPGFWAGNRCTLPLAHFAEDAPRIRKLTQAVGLSMPNVGTYVSCADMQAVEQAMQGTAALGAPQLRVNVPLYDGKTNYRTLRDRTRAQYREVEALARQYGLRALIEIHMGNLVPSASAAASFLEGFDPRYVGVIHDAGNMVYEGYENYQLGLELLGPYLGHVHLKNAQWQVIGTRPDGSTEWRANWAPIRGGIVDMAALFRALRHVGYDTWVSFEDFSTAQPLNQRIRDNLTYIKQVARQVETEATR